ncbi:MAG: polysaccharide ABC transporter ATP-binding protein [Vicinamibacterales bacterium]
MSIAVSVESVSKAYRLGSIGSATLQEDLARVWARVTRQPDPHAKIGEEDRSRLRGQTFWALDDVSFDVREGEALGIVGRNGAGKSTMLKVLSQVTAPTKGQIRVRGRIASLLEVGTGFHPDLTGRENIFLNGAILGMTKAEIRRKLDEIIAFSGVEQFVDTPVKRYSSGMYVRLAFAVAAHLEPEILVIDEVLAVGDAEFQAKCLGKMGEVTRGGRTVLFVSHNMEAVATLTQRAVLLVDGRVAKAGPSQEVISAYLGHGAATNLEYTGSVAPDRNGVSRLRLHTSSPHNVQQHGAPMTLEADLTVHRPLDSARFEVTACDADNRRIMHLWLYDSDDTPLCRTPGVHTLRCEIPRLHLYAGRYTLSIVLVGGIGSTPSWSEDGLCPFEVLMDRTREGGWDRGEATYLEDAHWAVAAPVAD